MGASENHVLQIVSSGAECELADFAHILNVFGFTVVSVYVEVRCTTLGTNNFIGYWKTVFVTFNRLQRFAKFVEILFKKFNIV
jgi:hypothetical protein